MAGAILTLNAGSSSIKFALFEMTDLARLKMLSKGQLEQLGGEPHFVAKDRTGTVLADESWRHADFQPLVEKVIGWAEGHLGADRLGAVGHRVAHGGPHHVRPARVTPDLLEVLEGLVPLAPLHEPHNIAPIRAVAAARPDLPQVVCFDTAFHHTMPAVASRYALPREYEATGIRRYGFHGLSYEYVAGRLREVAPGLAGGRVIVAHLGNGASLCALLDGRSIDTTMGFTPLDGLVMGTRCGSLDPGVVLYLAQARGLGPDAIEDLLYRRSGLLGVSGIASDMRDLIASGEARAGEAIELFVYRIAREIGALTASLGGLDGLVFTAGIGEGSPRIRTLVCARLGWAGAVLDERANERGAPVVSASRSRVALHVMPTDEEAMIARHTLAATRPPPSG